MQLLQVFIISIIHPLLPTMLRQPPTNISFSFFFFFYKNILCQQ